VIADFHLDATGAKVLFVESENDGLPEACSGAPEEQAGEMGDAVTV
jgi:hypothetical protein